MTERWSAQLLNSQDQVVADLPGVTGGSLEWSVFRSVPGSGELKLADPIDLGIEWQTARIRVRHHVGETAEPMGIWLPVVPAWSYEWPRRSASVKLLDKTELLNRPTGKWVSVGTTVPVTDWVRQTILDVTGEQAAIEPSDAALSAPQVFDPLEWTWLGAINAVLSTIGHSAVSATMAGALTSAKYLTPGQRTPVGTYGGAPGDLRMRKTFEDEAGVFDVPNVVVVISPASDTAQMIRGEARNDNPDSPLSTVNIGERPHVEEGEAASQEAADALAARRLQELSQVTRRVTWEHPVDATQMGDVVEFRPLDERLALVQRTIQLGKPGAVVETTGRRIYTGGESPW